KDKKKIVKKTRKVKKTEVVADEAVTSEAPIEGEATARPDETLAEQPETTEIVPEEELDELKQEFVEVEEMVFDKDKKKIVKKTLKVKKPEAVSSEAPIEGETTARPDETLAEQPETTEIAPEEELDESKQEFVEVEEMVFDKDKKKIVKKTRKVKKPQVVADEAPIEGEAPARPHEN